MTWFEHQVHEDFVDPVTEDEMYLIDLSAPARELEVERQRNEEVAEEILYLECEKQEITYQRRSQAKTLMNNIIFMKKIIDNNKDKIQLQPADVERLEDIVKEVKEWKEREIHVQRARSESTQQEFRRAATDLLETELTQVENTSGEPSGKENEADLNVEEEQESSQLTLSMSYASQSDLEKSFLKGFQSGLKIQVHPRVTYQLANWKMGFDAGREEQRRQAANLQITNVIAEIGNPIEHLEEENEVKEGERSTNMQEAEIVGDLVVYSTPPIKAILPETSDYVPTGTTPSFGAITAGIYTPYS